MTLDASALAELVRQAGPDVHGDPFAQARFLAACGFLAGAAATARAGAESQLRSALAAVGAWGAKVSRIEFAMLVNKACDAGAIDGGARNRLRKLNEKFSRVVHGADADLDQLEAWIDELATISSAMTAKATHSEA